MLEINNNSQAYFVSDLHLSNSTPKTLNAFETWLATVSRPNTLIFILGDLFDVWLGDDYTDETVLRVKTALQSSHSAGCKLFFMHGNRDFLIGDAFCDEVNCEMLPDPEFLLINNLVVLITHGDQLCTDDTNYQRFRHMTRSNNWVEDFLTKPLLERVAYAEKVRTQSNTEKKNKTEAIMDVNQKAVDNAFAGKWPDNTLLGRSDVVLHGHTHRCAVHGKKQPGLLKNTLQSELTQGQRIVLPDWRFDENNQTGAKGGFLLINANAQIQMHLLNN